MSNIALWNIRLRHESLSKPTKGKYLSKRKRSRIGIQEAMDRRSERASGISGDKSGSEA